MIAAMSLRVKAQTAIAIGLVGFALLFINVRSNAQEDPAEPAFQSPQSEQAEHPEVPSNEREPKNEEPEVPPAHIAPETTSAEPLPTLVLEDRVPEGWFRDRGHVPLRPERRRRNLPQRCRTQGGYIEYCQGPRLVATPPPEAARRAARLGLGREQTARWLLHREPFDEWIAEVAHLDRGRDMAFPVPGGYLGRGFGRVRRGSLRHRAHKGVDIGAPEGTPIVAAEAGLVMYSDNRITGYGNTVLLLHRDGYTTYYAHCARTLVGAGEFVTRGQPIAEVGATGFAWAPHLHFEWRQRGWPRDPARHFARDTSREEDESEGVE